MVEKLFDRAPTSCRVSKRLFVYLNTGNGGGTGIVFGTFVVYYIYIYTNNIHTVSNKLSFTLYVDDTTANFWLGNEQKSVS